MCAVFISVRYPAGVSRNRQACFESISRISGNFSRVIWSVATPMDIDITQGNINAIVMGNTPRNSLVKVLRGQAYSLDRRWCSRMIVSTDERETPSCWAISVRVTPWAFSLKISSWSICRFLPGLVRLAVARCRTSSWAAMASRRLFNAFLIAFGNCPMIGSSKSANSRAA